MAKWEANEIQIRTLKKLLARGLTYKEIAKLTMFSVKHLTRLFGVESNLKIKGKV